MTFITKKVKIQDLGEYLLSLRLKLGLSREDVFLATAVQPKWIKALEEGRLACLPPAVYVKGFLKSLAKVYKIDELSLLTQFEAEWGIANNLKSLEKAEVKKIVIPKFVLSPKNLKLLGAGLLGLVSLSYLYFQVSSLTASPQLEVFYPARDEIVDSSLLVVRGQAEEGAQVFLNNQAIVADAEGNFRENLSLGPGTNQLEIKAVNKFGQETVIKRSIVLLEREIAGSFTEDREGQLVLEIKIGEGSSWIYLEADGVVEYAGTMLPQFQKKFTADKKILLTTGNAGATRVIFNGNDLGVLGKEGEVLRNIEFSK